MAANFSRMLFFFVFAALAAPFARGVEIATGRMMVYEGVRDHADLVIIHGLDQIVTVVRV